MRLYTRKGDDGRTHLCGGPRVAKDDPHIEACGAVDELNAWMGVVRAESLPQDVDQVLHRIQHELFSVGADLALTGPAGDDLARVVDRHVQSLERDIDAFEAELPPLQEFILPGGIRAAALLHVARTVCRRAERRVVSLHKSCVEDPRQSTVVSYLNRLGDLLFVLPRVLNARAALTDERWRKNRPENGETSQ